MRSPLTIGIFRDERGGPLAEMAVLLLPFVLIVAMVIEGGNIFWRHQISLKAVRDAARYVSRAPLLFDDACDLDDIALQTAVFDAKRLGATGSLQGGVALIPGWTAADIDIPVPIVLATDPCLALVQASASVDLTLPFAPVFRLFDPSIGDVLRFSVSDRTRWLGE